MAWASETILRLSRVFNVSYNHFSVKKLILMLLNNYLDKKLIMLLSENCQNTNLIMSNKWETFRKSRNAHVVL